MKQDLQRELEQEKQQIEKQKHRRRQLAEKAKKV
jgi:hypothetical protein